MKFRNKLPRRFAKIALIPIISIFLLLLGFTDITRKRTIAEGATCPAILQMTINSEVTLIASNYSSDSYTIDCSNYDLNIVNNGSLKIVPDITNNSEISDDHGLKIYFRNITIEEGGEISLTGLGYPSGEQSEHIGSGKSSVTTCEFGRCGGSGGGHGGDGGRGNPDQTSESAAAGDSYGLESLPTTIGSGGGASAEDIPGGNGGGAMQLVVLQETEVNGGIYSNGTPGNTNNLSAGGGGAGGSIYLQTNTLSGNGQITATGGDGGIASVGNGGGGAGGRIAISVINNNNFTGTTSVKGGTGGIQDGQTGSLIGPSIKPNATLTLTQEISTVEITDNSDIDSSNIDLVMNITDLNENADIYPQIEVVKTGESFTNIPTHTGSLISYTEPVDATISVQGIQKGYSYKWQARLINEDGLAGDWIEYEQDDYEEIDFNRKGDPYEIVKISGDLQTGTVGEAITNPLVVQVNDINGLPLPNTTIYWQVLAGGGSVSSSQTTTNASGQTSVNFTLGTTTGVNKVAAVRSGLEGSPLQFTAAANADIIHHYSVEIKEKVALTLENFNLTITAQDQYNNTITDATNSVNLAPLIYPDLTPATGVLSTTNTTLISGTKTLTLSHSEVETIAINVSDAGSIEGTSNAIKIISSYGDCLGVANEAINSPLIISDAQTFEATTSNQGIMNCSNIDIQITGTGTLTLDSYDSGDSNYNNDLGTKVIAKSLTIDSAGKITANGFGYYIGRGPGATTATYKGAGYGGYGGASGGQPYGGVYEPLLLGSGVGVPGRGANGGGAIELDITNTLTINGSITANGNNGVAWGGGGSGGSIYIKTNTIGGTGLIQANGGRGDQRGGGAGGRIAVYYTNQDTIPFNFSVNYIQALGHNGGWDGSSAYAGPGTIYIEDQDLHSPQQGILYIDNNNRNGYAAALIEDNYNFEQIKLLKQGKLDVLGEDSILTILSGMDLTGDSTYPALKIYGTLNYTSPDPLKINGVNLSLYGDYTNIDDLDIGTLWCSDSQYTNSTDCTNNGEIWTSTNGAATLYARTWARAQNYTFENINIGANGTLNLVSYDNGDSDWSNDYGVTLNTTTLTIDTGGTLTSTGQGYYIGRGPGATTATYKGAGYGGYGGASGGQPYGGVYEPLLLGSGVGVPGRGANGGGAIQLNVSNTLTINGTISSNGNNGIAWGGGGSGGSIYIDANTIGGTGSIQANGGRGDQRGGGSGGRIAVYYTNQDSTPFEFSTSHIQALGNNGGWDGGSAYAGPGTIYIENKNTHSPKEGILRVSNSNRAGDGKAALMEGNYSFASLNTIENGLLNILGEGSVLNISSESGIQGDATMPDITIYGTLNYTGSNTLYINGVDLGLYGPVSGLGSFGIGNTLNAGVTLYANNWGKQLTEPFIFNDIHIASLGILTLVGYDNGDSDWTNDYGASLDVNNLTIDSGGIITSDSLGYYISRGPGGTSNIHQGGAYGGYGDDSSSLPYGNVYEPTLLGSGVGEVGRGANGGGAIILNISNSLVNNGLITANGQNGTAWGGGGSGGSVYIQTQNIEGSGTITTNGGKGDQQGGGSGGRIALYYDNNSEVTPYNLDTTGLQSIGNNGGYEGTSGYAGPGTIYVENLGYHYSQGGLLFVSNSNRSGLSASLSEDTYLFTKITLVENGHLTIEGEDSRIQALSSDALSGDSTMPDLTIEGTFEYINTDPLSIDGVDVGFKGEIEGIQDLEIGKNSNGGATLYANTWARAGDPYQFNDLTVGTNGTLTLVGYNNSDSDWENDYGTHIQANNITIDSGGEITTNEQGYGIGEGPGASTETYKGAGYGGYGGNNGGLPYGSVFNPTQLGSGTGVPGRGSKGGGAIKLEIFTTLTLNGTISANGQNGTAWGGGGSGGSILIQASELSGNGLIESNGGIGDQHGGGSGGRIAIYYETIYESSPFELTPDHIRALGNNGTWDNTSSYAGPGTIYIENTQTDTTNEGYLIVDASNRSSRNSAISSDTYNFKQIQITNSAKLEILGSESILSLPSSTNIIGDNTDNWIYTNGVLTAQENNLRLNGLNIDSRGSININNLSIGDSWCTNTEMQTEETCDTEWITGDSELILNATVEDISFENLIVGDSGTLTLKSVYTDDDDVSNDYGVKLNVTSLDVKSGGLISANGRGYIGGEGIADINEDSCGTDNCTGGSGHGGIGSDFITTGGLSYGNLYQPTTLGSGSTGGGGAIQITSIDITLNGTISSNGLAGTGNQSASSGGSIYITTDSITGTGNITANGGNGGGAGGRIAIYSENDIAIEKDNISANGLTGGGPGTIYLQNSRNLDLKNGDLIIDNGGNVGVMELLTGEYFFTDLSITENLTIKTRRSSEEDLGLIINLTGDFTLPSTSTITADGQGYLPSEGIGAGTSGTSTNPGLPSSGAGGSHLGSGGRGMPGDQELSPEPGITYDSTILANMPGSGGGNGSDGTLGGNGGGLIHIVSSDGILNIYGTISANGTDGETGDSSGGGGAGGSIYLQGKNIFISSSSILQAKGGAGGNGLTDGGGGGGGIIIVSYTNNLSNEGLLDIDSGSGYQDGGSGVTYDYGIPTISQYEQKDIEEGETIPVGGTLNKKAIIFEFNITDPDLTAELIPQIEILPAEEGSEFTGESILIGNTITKTDEETITAQVLVISDDSPSVLGAQTYAFDYDSVYKWRARVIDEDGILSDWLDFGGNGDSYDFAITQSCGNGIVDQGELCDGNNLNSMTCTDQGFDGGSLSCNSSCTFDTQYCTNASCGNNIMEAGEQCDGSTTISCKSLGYDSENILICTNTCSLDTSVCFNTNTEEGNTNQEDDTPACGNGVLENGEQCDGSTNLLCSEFGDFTSGKVICNNECQIDTSGCSFAPDNKDDTGKEKAIEFSKTAIKVATTAIVSLVGLNMLLTFLLSLPHRIESLLLGIFSILRRKENNYWGVVYDSVTKAPITKAIVRIYSEGKIVGSYVTNTYGIFTTPTLKTGNYTLQITHPEYIFPSEIVQSSVDGKYKNIYYGQTNIDLSIPVNIPGDFKGRTIFEKLFSKVKNRASKSINVISTLTFSLSFILSLLLVYKDKSLINILILSTYVFFTILYIFSKFRKSTKGKLITNRDISSLKMILRDEFGSDKRVIDINNDGRYELFLTPDKYTLVIKDDKNEIYKEILDVRKPKFIIKKIRF